MLTKISSIKKEVGLGSGLVHVHEKSCKLLIVVVIVQPMENILFTILAATLLVGFALFLLAIGFLLSGKKLRRGCGLTPKRKKEEKGACSLCGSHKPCDDDEVSHEEK